MEALQVEELRDYTKIKMYVRQRCIFSTDVFNLQSEATLKEREVLSGFIIGKHNPNNVRYADYTVVVKD